MLIAILSDLHSNLPALNAVLDDAQQWETEEFWCLGDVVGYGPWPLQVWQRLISLNISRWGWVAGNQDWGLVGRLDGHVYVEIERQRFPLGYFRPEASQVIALHKDSLQNQSSLLEHLASLPVVASPRLGVYLAHGRFMQGDVVNCMIQYVRGQPEVEASWQTLNDHPLPWEVDDSLQAASPEGWGPPRLMIVGHTHQPALWRRDSLLPSNGGRWQRLPLPVENWFPLDDLESRPVFLNPGSVGQPRDYSMLARYVLLEWQPSQVPRLLVRQIKYDYRRTQNKMRKSNYPKQLIGMLGVKPPAGTENLT